ncbi:MAG TPA: hypothetical protein VNX29_12360 [Kaistia sp.]|nr:hypothetical protein [Kaistia sp.]
MSLVTPAKYTAGMALHVSKLQAAIRQNRFLSFFVFFCIVGAIICIAFHIYWSRLQPDDLNAESDIGQAFGSLAVFFSFVASIGVVAALLLQRESMKSQLDANERDRIESTRELGLLFYSATLLDYRAKSHKARVGFLSKDFDRSAFASRWVDNDAIDEFKYQKLTTGELESIDANATSLLIEFYCLLLDHAKLVAITNAEAAEAMINRYLWPYWRGYLLKLGDAIEARRDSVLRSNLSVDGSQFPLVSWVRTLRELDQLSGLPKYEPQKNLLDAMLWRD